MPYKRLWRCGSGVVFLPGFSKITLYIRCIIKPCKVMIHDPSISGLSHTNALELQVVSQDLLDTRKSLAEILAKHTGRTVESILEKTTTDCYFDAEAAIEFGLADSII